MTFVERYPHVKFKCPQFTNLWGNPTIGGGTGGGAFTEIGDGVTIGRNCSISAYVFICPGVTIEDDCFIGPGTVFTNDKRPPGRKEDWGKTLVRRGASIGARVVILPGITIGEGAMVGAGSVVTKDVQPGMTVVGVPARAVLGQKQRDKLDAILQHAKDTEERFLEGLNEGRR